MTSLITPLNEGGIKIVCFRVVIGQGGDNHEVSILVGIVFMGGCPNVQILVR